MKQRTVQNVLTASILWTAAVVSVASIATIAHAGPRIMKKDRVASLGQCTGPLSGSVDDVLRRAGVRTSKATKAQRFALAKGIQQIERLTGGAQMTGVKGATFNFLNGRGGVSNQGATINMRGGEARTANTAYLMHELGHRIGNSGQYSKYKSAVRTPCIATHYCRTSYSKARYRNEEFAEVFSAFVTHPEILLNGSASCKAAYNYFANNVFKNGRQLATCGAATTLVAQGKDPLNVIRAVASTSEPKVSMRAASLNCPEQEAKKPAKGLVQLADYLDDEVHASL